MKKITVVLLALLFATSVFTEGVLIAMPNSEASIYNDIQPLEKKTSLVISTHPGTHHAFIVYLIKKFGGYEKAGIDAKIITFSNGPVQMESLASNSWDCGTTGLGGVINGVLRNNLVVIGAAAKDNASIDIFAKNTTDIVKTGPTTAHKVYGTANQWKGREIVLPAGSTLHYTLARGLAELGLSLDDVKVIHMDVSSVNTALLAGKADIGGVWGAYSYGKALNTNYTKVMNADDLKTNISVTIVANPNSYADPVKKAAIAKFVELFYSTSAWVYANNGANLNKAAEYFTAISEECGITSTAADNLTTLTHDKIYTLDEAYAMFNDKTADGYSPLYAGHYGPLAFYVEKIGNYTASDLAKFKTANFDASIVNSLYQKKK
jgi:ABC-type nitrate/sulfonate/bicarbonate transport system substrate-binding protein